MKSKQAMKNRICPQLQTGYNFMDMPSEEYDTAAAEKRNEKQKSDNYYNWPIGEIKEPKFMHKYGYYECSVSFIRKSLTN